MSATTIPKLVFAPSSLLPEACRAIVQHAARGDDLSHATVLVPDLHAVSAVARALRASHQRPALLLPRITTLRQWANEVPLQRGVDGAAAREAAVYHVLDQRGWFPGADLWTVAAELTGLIDELTRWRIGLPDSADDFVRRLDRAYAARAGVSFDFEAKLVHVLWHALAGDGADAEAAYQQRLGILAREALDPIFTIGLTRLAPAEREFFERCADRVGVTHMTEDLAAGRSLLERTLEQAWPQDGAATLLDRAHALRELSAEPGLGGRIRFFAAGHAEEEAAAIAASIHGWLQAGARSIAVVTLDRSVARRARALLERSRVLVRDEMGWPLSTTSAATAIGRWFDGVTNDFYHRDLFDLLKSPFAFADLPRDQRRQTVWRLEQTLRRANLRAGLDRYLDLCREGGDPSLQRMLLRVQKAARNLVRSQRRTLAGWVAALVASLRSIGVEAGFRADAAGIEILQLLEALAVELAAEAITVPLAEFRRFLARRLEAAAFRDASIDSPVVFTSLEATRLRSFDCLLIMGADATQLTASGDGGMFLNQRVRSELGLPGAADRGQDLQRMLAGVLCRSGQVLISWQRNRRGEPNLIAPLFEQLRTLHELAWGDPAADTGLPEAIERLPSGAHADHPLPRPGAAPAPSITPERLPASISASGYNALMACPYQFYARYLLRLREADEVQEELEKSDYGMRVHEILTRFHRQHPRVLDLTRQAAEQALQEISQAVFRDDVTRDYVAKAWLTRWRNVLPGYVAWQREREGQGWHFHAGETDRSVRIVTPQGRSVVLRGRIDRVDRTAAGDVALLDYKTRARQRLAADLECRGEDVQLPVYALLWGDRVSQALYVPVDAERIEPVAFGDDIEQHTADVANRLAELLDRMAQGAPLPAQGIASVCEYCEMGGLCRRKHWP